MQACKQTIHTTQLILSYKRLCWKCIISASFYFFNVLKDSWWGGGFIVLLKGLQKWPFTAHCLNDTESWTRGHSEHWFSTLTRATQAHVVSSHQELCKFLRNPLRLCIDFTLRPPVISQHGIVQHCKRVIWSLCDQWISMILSAARPMDQEYTEKNTGHSCGNNNCAFYDLLRRILPASGPDTRCKECACVWKKEKGKILVELFIFEWLCFCIAGGHKHHVW